MPISVFTLFTASTASPSEASGARLNESVTTGNWPWWFTVIGALDVSTCVKALSGTCPPFGNAVEEEIPLPNTVLEAIVGLLAEADVEALATAAPAPLCGPNVWVAEEPPETTPAVLRPPDRKSTRLNSSHLGISYAVF